MDSETWITGGTRDDDFLLLIFTFRLHLRYAGNKKKSSVILLTLPFQLIPVLLDGHVPLPLQVDDLVVVDEPGLDHILAV